MIPCECKRLGEVDFPIAEVSRHAVREKSIRYGAVSDRRWPAAAREASTGQMIPHHARLS